MREVYIIDSFDKYKDFLVYGIQRKLSVSSLDWFEFKNNTCIFVDWIKKECICYLFDLFSIDYFLNGLKCNIYYIDFILYDSNIDLVKRELYNCDF